MKLSLCQAHCLNLTSNEMPYNMHGMVSTLLNLARKEKHAYSNLSRREAVALLRSEGLIRIHGGHIVFLAPSEEESENEYDNLFSDTHLISESFYLSMTARGGDTIIPWRHVLLLIKASYGKRKIDSGIRMRNKTSRYLPKY